jgi:L-malate glycosyltransferase
MVKERIRVLHIIKSLGRGGAETLLPETLKLHNQNQFEFHYIYFLPWKNQLVEALIDNGGRVTCLASGNSVSMMARIPAVVRYIKTHHIDVIHAHLPWAGILARCVKKLTGITVFYTEHNKQERYHFLTRFINLNTMNLLSGLIAVSDDVADSVRKHKRRLNIPILTLLNGVNHRSFKRGLVPSTVRQNLNIPAQAIVVGTVAVFRFQKRLDLWLEIARKVIDANQDVYFIVVGDGPLKNELLTKATELGITQKVYFVGLQQEVRPYLEAMDIYFMTSLYEGLPIALLEAMSFNLPVVTTNAGGIKQVVRNNIDGFICDVQEPERLGWSLLNLVKDQSLRSTFGNNARARVQNEFSLDRMVLQLEDLYTHSHGAHHNSLYVNNSNP